MATDIIKAICKNIDWQITLICPPINVYRKLIVEASKLYVPSLLLKAYSRWILDYFWLKNTINKLSPDMVVSLGNLPAVCEATQIMFNDNAFVSEKEIKGFGLTLKELLAHSIRKKIFIARLSYVDFLVVQTDYEKQKFIQNYLNLPPIHVLPPLFPEHLLHAGATVPGIGTNIQHGVRLGCISYVYGHKNLEILIAVLNLAQKKKFQLQILFTLAPEKKWLTRSLKKKLKPLIASGYAVNLGKIRPTQIKAILSQLDGLILPSLNESYSLNYIEALCLGKRLLVSDRQFSRSICGNNAVYFNPLDAHDILNKIYATFATGNIQNNNNMTVEEILPVSSTEDLYSFLNSKMV